MAEPITTEDGKPLDPTILEGFLGRITASGVLGDKSRLRVLLKFVVDETIAGRAASLKAYTIGTLALGRGDDFDPSSDSIVRVEMNRLRQALDHYYATKGEQDTLRITIPKGTYRPVFITQATVIPVTPNPAEDSSGVPTTPTTPASATGSAATAPAPAPTVASYNRFIVGGVVAGFVLLVGIVIADYLLHHRSPNIEVSVPPIELAEAPLIQVQQFHNLIQTPDMSYLAEGLQAQLVADLSHFPILRVRHAIHIGDGTAPLNHRPADYHIKGTVVELDSDIRLTLLLLDASTDQVLWSTVRDIPTAEDNLSRNMLNAVRSIVAQLAAPSGVLQAEELRELNNQRALQSRPVPISTYECILRWRAYDSYKSNAERERVHECLNNLVANDSESASIWAAHAFFKFLDWTRETDLSDWTGLEAALRAANRAIQLDPTDSSGHEYLASILMARGDLDAALQSYARAVALNPSNPDLRVLLGWNRILREDWENGLRDVQEGIAISPNPPGWFRIPLSLDAFRRGQYQQALSQADLMIINGDERGIPLALAAAIRLNNETAIDRYRLLLAESSLNQDQPMGSIQAVLNIPELMSEYRQVLASGS